MAVENEIYALMEKLFPICRSLTGAGVRETLAELKEICPEMKIHEVPTGTKAFDWQVPQEWSIREAYIENEAGERIIDFHDNNLHVVSYSEPVDKVVDLSALKKVVYTYPANPKAIPYVTSYYSRKYGFCMSKNQQDSLSEGKYHLYIDSSLFDGSLTYGEIVLPGSSDKEVLFSTYVCHPSMANNELSGPGVAIYLAKYLSEHKHKYTYRFVFVPETLGSIVYISRNLQHLQAKVIAGFNLSCLGDGRAYTYVATRQGNTLSDRVVKRVLEEIDPHYRSYSFLNRGSDERQYNMPGVDIPVCGLYRTKSNEYPEYHTSADNMSIISTKALRESYEWLMGIVKVIEANDTYRTTCLCEPQLGKRGLYPQTGTRGSSKASGAWAYINFLAYADGSRDLLDLSSVIGTSLANTISMAEALLEKELIVRV